MQAYASTVDGDGFDRSRTLLEEAVGWLAEPAAGELPHADLEQQLQRRSWEVFGQLLQDHLDLRAQREEQAARQTPVEPVRGCDGVTRRYVEPGHDRGLVTVFGTVSVTRLAYRAKGVPNLCPADAGLNLPAGLHSHGLARLAAIEAARGSFAAARAAIERATGVRIGVRQVRRLAESAAVDVPAFYASRQAAAAKTGDALALSVDGKGIVIRPDSLREQTAKAAATTRHKLSTRLSKGEKANRKRMAEVGCVYDFTPAVRTPADVISPPGRRRRTRAPGPKAAGKWLHASVARPAGQVIADVFDEAARRERDWVALVDGNNHQIDRIAAEAAARGVTVTIIIDFVHVMEYLWQAAWCLHPEADPAAETWVARQATNVLTGKAGYVAALIRRTAMTMGLSGEKRHRADEAAGYLLAKRPHLDYPTALAAGWPIATGVIEGACRHLIADRMDITGTRWSLPGAEAVLKLRALTSNGDFNDYWTYHLEQEKQRVHASRYADGIIPT